MRSNRRISHILEVDAHASPALLAEVMFAQLRIPAISPEALLENFFRGDPFDVLMEGVDVQVAVNVADGAIALIH